MTPDLSCLPCSRDPGAWQNANGSEEGPRSGQPWRGQALRSPRRQKTQIRPEPEVSAEDPQAPGLLHPDPGAREGPLPESGGLSEPAGWGPPGAALPGEGGPLEGTCVPGRGGRGTPEVRRGALPARPAWGGGGSEDAGQQSPSTATVFIAIKMAQNPHWAPSRTPAGT